MTHDSLTMKNVRSANASTLRLRKILLNAVSQVGIEVHTYTYLLVLIISKQTVYRTQWLDSTNAQLYRKLDNYGAD